MRPVTHRSSYPALARTLLISKTSVVRYYHLFLVDRPLEMRSPSENVVIYSAPPKLWGSNRSLTTPILAYANNYERFINEINSVTTHLFGKHRYSYCRGGWGTSGYSRHYCQRTDSNLAFPWLARHTPPWCSLFAPLSPANNQTSIENISESEVLLKEKD